MAARNREQHALYQALKAFGQIPKSRFILGYIEDPALRQAIRRPKTKVKNGGSGIRGSTSDQAGFCA
jgi:TnpA family transposase